VTSYKPYGKVLILNLRTLNHPINPTAKRELTIALTG